MSRKITFTLLQELAWALHTAKRDIEHRGGKYGQQSNVVKALKRYRRERARTTSYDQWIDEHL